MLHQNISHKLSHDIKTEKYDYDRNVGLQTQTAYLSTKTMLFAAKQGYLVDKL